MRLKGLPKEALIYSLPTVSPARSSFDNSSTFTIDQPIMQKSFSDLEYAAKKKLTRLLPRRDQHCYVVRKAAQADQAALSEERGAGRPPIGLARMLRMYVAQQYFGLSDEGMEDAIYDSQAIHGFVGIDLNRESAPDATTLLKFHHLL